MNDIDRNNVGHVCAVIDTHYIYLGFLFYLFKLNYDIYLIDKKKPLKTEERMKNKQNIGKNA